MMAISSATSADPCPCCLNQECTCAGLCFSPSFFSDIYYADVAGFVDGEGVNCASRNGTIRFCHTTTLGSTLEWKSPTGQSILQYDESTDTWLVLLQFDCGDGSIEAYTYTCDRAIFNGCGSATFDLETDPPLGPPTGTCPCDAVPDTIVVRTAEGDPANCNCPCFLHCPDPFPTSLYVRLNGFSYATVWAGTTIDLTVNFDMSPSSFFLGCASWRILTSPIFNAALDRAFSVLIQVACNQDNTMSITLRIVQIAGLDPNSYLFESFTTSACVDCYSTGTAINQSGDDTLVFQVKCTPFA